MLTDNNDTELNILKQLGIEATPYNPNDDNDDDDDNGSDDGEASSEGSGNNEGQDENIEKAQANQGNKQPNSRSNNQNDSQQPKAGKGKQAADPQDNRRKIVDNETGEEIKAGVEMRLYNKSKRFEQELHTTRVAYNELNDKNKQLQDFKTKYDTFGLKDAEAVAGLDFINKLKSDPIKAVEHLLAELKAGGVDLSKVMSDSIDTQAIKNIIKEELKTVQPLVNAHESQVQEQRDRQEATGLLDTFIDRNPDAEMHLEDLALIMEATNIPISEAWKDLQLYAYKKGLDISKPLAEQLNNNNQQSRASKKTKFTEPLPNGRGGLPNNGDDEAIKQRKYAPAEMSTRDIVSEAMRELGYK